VPVFEVEHNARDPRQEGERFVKPPVPEQLLRVDHLQLLASCTKICAVAADVRRNERAQAKASISIPITTENYEYG
jgi:hypothetical protein